MKIKEIKGSGGNEERCMKAVDTPAQVRGVLTLASPGLALVPTNPSPGISGVFSRRGGMSGRLCYLVSECLVSDIFDSHSVSDILDSHCCPLPLKTPKGLAVPLAI